MKPLIFATMFLSIFAFMSCTGSSKKGQMEKYTPNTTEAARNKTNTESTIGTDTVLIKQMKFVPEVLYANVGDTITFINRDFVKHDVTEEKSRSWSSSVMNYGDTWRMVVSKSEDYFCSLHVVMKGKIITKQMAYENI